MNRLKVVGIPEKWLNMKRHNDNISIRINLNGLEVLERGDYRYRVMIEGVSNDTRWHGEWHEFTHD